MKEFKLNSAEKYKDGSPMMTDLPVQLVRLLKRIELLEKKVREYEIGQYTASDKEALNMAINALSLHDKPKSNADKIRAMDDEELVKSIGLACKRCAYYKVGHGECSGQDKECTDGNLEWLRKEADEDAGTD